MLPVVILLRNYKPTHTEGSVILPNGEVIKSLERAWLNNASNVSCYPEGVYLAKWLERSGSGKYKRVWHVQKVPKRSGILWHMGNLIRHTLGCTLPGMRHGKLNGLPAVLASGTGLNKMRRLLGGQDFILVVANASEAQQCSITTKDNNG